MTRFAEKLAPHQRQSGLREGRRPPGFASRVFVCVALLTLGLASSLALSGSLAAQQDAAGDPDRGAAAYRSTCGGCHSIEKNRIGPRHKGVLGRKSGTQPDYAYSKALKEAGLTWDEKNLDRWIADPRATVPGTKMATRVSDPMRRADIIAYLATQ